jgi:hypothetical protein
VIQRIAALVLLVAMPILGCGEEEEGPTAPRGGNVPESVRAAELKAGKVKAVVALTFTENKAWNAIKTHFQGSEKDAEGVVERPFVSAKIDNLRDPFEPQLVRFIPKIELVSSERSASGDAADATGELLEEELDNPPQATELGETQHFRAQDYRPVLIKWGTSMNKALVQDPDGNTFVVAKDMKLGNNNGRITDITRYEIWVQEDNQDEPIPLSIEPEIYRLKATLVEDGGSRLFPRAAEH